MERTWAQIPTLANVCVFLVKSQFIVILKLSCCVICILYKSELHKVLIGSCLHVACVLRNRINTLFNKFKIPTEAIPFSVLYWLEKTCFDEISGKIEKMRNMSLL